MIRSHSTNTPVLKSPANEAGCHTERGSIAKRSSIDEAEWERSLFLQPARLAEARRQATARSRRWSGLLLAGLAALTVGIGEVRATDALAATAEESTTALDYWELLASWLGQPTEKEETAELKNGEGTTDPGEGD